MKPINRRNFLKQAGCVAGVLAICPAVLLPKAKLGSVVSVTLTCNPAIIAWGLLRRQNVSLNDASFFEVAKGCDEIQDFGSWCQPGNTVMEEVRRMGQLGSFILLITGDAIVCMPNLVFKEYKPFMDKFNGLTCTSEDCAAADDFLKDWLERIKGGNLCQDI